MLQRPILRKMRSDIFNYVFHFSLGNRICILLQLRSTSVGTVIFGFGFSVFPQPVGPTRFYPPERWYSPFGIREAGKVKGRDKLSALGDKSPSVDFEICSAKRRRCGRFFPSPSSLLPEFFEGDVRGIADKALFPIPVPTTVPLAPS